MLMEVASARLRRTWSSREGVKGINSATKITAMRLKRDDIHHGINMNIYYICLEFTDISE